LIWWPLFCVRVTAKAGGSFLQPSYKAMKLNAEKKGSFTARMAVFRHCGQLGRLELYH
jgi:hypothetical protein